MAINSSLTDRQQLLNGIEKNKRIVVFCQSSGCGYSDEVAQFLKFNGYSNVVLYRGGYREWSRKFVANYR
jgi:rhodanese-related sulfurtransferase